MSLFDGFLNMMRLNSDDEDEFYNEEYYDDEDGGYEDEKPSKRSHRKAAKEAEQGDYRNEPHVTTKEKSKTTPKVTPMRSNRKQGSGMEVCVIKPTSVEDAREITETLLSNRTVVLNVEGLDLDVAQRIIDFTSGSCYAIRGNLQKISNYIFIITPESVDISGDFLNMMDVLDASAIKNDY